MHGRKHHSWHVRLQAEDSRVVTYRVSTYWDPKRDDTEYAVGNAARVQAYFDTAGRHGKFAVIDGGTMLLPPGSNGKPDGILTAA